MRSRGLLFGVIAWLVLACAAGSSGTAAPPANPTGTSGSALVGSWLVSITKADVAAAGVTDPGLQNENSGAFTWTFSADGTWTQIQVSLDGSPIGNPVYRGTYTVSGDSLVATTTFPDEYRDSGLHYTFAIDGSSVRFDLLDPPDKLLPIIVETHPWTRAS